jgi:hypothetical protein
LRLSRAATNLETVASIAILEKRHNGASTGGANMAKFPFGMAVVAVTFALVAARGLAYAQSEVPDRNGNTWDWRDHQPTEAGVSRKEKAAGITPTPARSRSNSATVDELYRQLMHQPPG